MADTLTQREIIALDYLTGVMEANAATIGKTILAKYTVKKAGSNLSSIGATVAMRLRRRGLVVRNELGWRITQKGRGELARVNG